MEYLLSVDLPQNHVRKRDTLQFFPYPSIDNPSAKYLEKLQHIALSNPNSSWVALEKIHGANFSFIFDGQTLVANKRSGKIEQNEKFYGYEIVVERYRKDIEVIFNYLQSRDASVYSIQVFGELFGGSYDGKSAAGACRVQKGVSYIDFVDFLVFDIRINADTCIFLAHSSITQLLSILGLSLRLVPILGRGSFEEMYKLSRIFESTVPSLYNLPKLNNNPAEGLIIKLDKDHSTGINRPILKNKNDVSFSEVDFKPKSRPVIDNSLSEESKSILERIICYLTRNRLDGVIGKEGPYCHRAKLRNVFINDAIKDYLKDVTSEESANFKQNEEKLRKHIIAYIEECGIMKLTVD
jgi:Rnl2 family RNA ligase